MLWHEKVVACSLALSYFVNRSSLETSGNCFNLMYIWLYLNEGPGLWIGGCNPRSLYLISLGGPWTAPYSRRCVVCGSASRPWASNWLLHVPVAESWRNGSLGKEWASLVANHWLMDESKDVNYVTYKDFTPLFFFLSWTNYIHFLYVVNSDSWMWEDEICNMKTNMNSKELNNCVFCCRLFPPIFEELERPWESKLFGEARSRIAKEIRK